MAQRMEAEQNAHQKRMERGVSPDRDRENDCCPTAPQEGRCMAPVLSRGQRPRVKRYGVSGTGLPAV